MNRVNKKTPKKSRRRSTSKKQSIKKSRRRSTSKKQAIKKSRRRSKKKYDSFGAIPVIGVGAPAEPFHIQALEPPEIPNPEIQNIESPSGSAEFDRWVYRRLYDNAYEPVEPENNIWRNNWENIYFIVIDSFRSYLVTNEDYVIINNYEFRNIHNDTIVDIRDKYNIHTFLENFANII